MIPKIEDFTIPESLLNIPSPPKKLSIRGIFPVTEKYLCVVGGRTYTEYGKRACQELISKLRNFSITIVSGLALGIDSIAHETALSVGLPTIAFPGSGLDDRSIYPSNHFHLATSILSKGGCLISEYNEGERGAPWMFPKRNRLMAGISDASFIIEAKIKSGTLITARLAMEYNKTVLALPGSIYSEYSEGPNSLIAQGAIPILNSDCILRELGFNIEESENTPQTKEQLLETLKNTCSEEEIRVISKIIGNPQTKDAIARETKVHISELNIILSILEFKGLIEERLGIIYIKI